MVRPADEETPVEKEDAEEEVVHLQAHNVVS